MWWELCTDPHTIYDGSLVGSVVFRARHSMKQTKEQLTHMHATGSHLLTFLVKLNWLQEKEMLGLGKLRWVNSPGCISGFIFLRLLCCSSLFVI